MFNIQIQADSSEKLKKHVFDLAVTLGYNEKLEWERQYEMDFRKPAVETTPQVVTSAPVTRTAKNLEASQEKAASELAPPTETVAVPRPRGRPKKTETVEASAPAGQEEGLETATVTAGPVLLRQVVTEKLRELFKLTDASTVREILSTYKAENVSGVADDKLQSVLNMVESYIAKAKK